ncbi:TPA: hypothetical protein QEM98_000437 [Stenotrophomonas maltophilia]|nr:hypothetical protein [Stenotrophomonas maltophilia]
MSDKHTLPPLQRQALLSMLADPERALTRVPGGFYCPASRPHPVFTGRTVKAMERDGLVKLDAPLCTTRVDFTEEGLAIATRLHEADQAQAGAA